MDCQPERKVNICLKRFLQFCLLFVLMVTVGFALLYLSGLLPQQSVDTHFSQSAEVFQREMEYPRFYGTAEANIVDNYTDMLILSEAKYTDTAKNPISIFSNPYLLVAGMSMPESLAEAAQGQEANGVYSRYWGGFRVTVRALLTVLNYGQIRNVVRIAFVLLLAIVCLSLLKNCGWGVALAFGFTILMFNVMVIAISLQYSCCFLISFAAMLLVRPMHKRGMSPAVFFFIVGGVTQYFDFYTAPLLTFALPFCYLLLLRDDTFKQNSVLFARCILAWFAAYFFMWVAKFTISGWLLRDDSVSIAIQGLLFRIGVSTAGKSAEICSPLTAYRRVFSVLFSDEYGINRIAVWVLLGVWALMFALGKGKLPGMPKSFSFLLPALLVLLWYAIAAQPSCVHAYFQYRTLAAFIFPLMLFLLKSVRPKGLYMKKLRDLRLRS